MGGRESFWKSFGRDLESASALNDVVRGVFKEKTVYRIEPLMMGPATDAGVDT